MTTDEKPVKLPSRCPSEKTIAEKLTEEARL